MAMKIRRIDAWINKGDELLFYWGAFCIKDQAEIHDIKNIYGIRRQLFEKKNCVLGMPGLREHRLWHNRELAD